MARTAALSSGETPRPEDPTEPKKTLRSRLGRKHARYAATSVVTVLTGQSLLAFGFYVAQWKAQTANLFSFSIATTVGYLINRFWTWEVSQRSGLAVQGLWFWGLSLVGLGFSQLAVRAAESSSQSMTDSRALQTVAVNGASLAAFGAVWIVKFVVLDRFVFTDRKGGGG